MEFGDFDLQSRFEKALKGIRKPKPQLDQPTVEVETTEGDEGEKDARVGVKPIHINLFQHPDAHPIALDLALLTKYGPQWLTWETEVLEHLIPQDFRTSSVSDLNMDKIQAVKAMHFVDTYWTNWEVFVWCTMPLNEIYPDFGSMQVPTVAQCMVSVDTANRIRTDVQWSQEIKSYLAMLYKFDGIFCPLEPVSFVELQVPGVVDCEEIRRRWPEVRASGHSPTAETIVDEQLRRMLVAHNYLELNRSRLQRQLATVYDA